jgi:hypothetical protein
LWCFYIFALIVAVIAAVLVAVDNNGVAASAAVLANFDFTHTHTLYEFLCRKDNQLPFLSFYFVFVLGANSGMLFLASATQLKRSMPSSSDTRAALVLIDLTSWTFCSSK